MTQPDVMAGLAALRWNLIEIFEQEAAATFREPQAPKQQTLLAQRAAANATLARDLLGRNSKLLFDCSGIEQFVTLRRIAQTGTIRELETVWAAGLLES